MPGSAPAAVLMAAMIIRGVQPGPMQMTTQPQFVFDVVAITLLATLAILVLGLPMVRPQGQAAKRRFARSRGYA